MVRRHHPVLAVVSNCYSEPKGRFPRVTHPCATRPEGLVRLACVRHAASVRSEPESNSQVHVRSKTRGKTQAEDRHLREPFLHITYYCGYVLRHIGTANLTDQTTPRGRRRPEPPPTCPFIKITMSKSRHVIFPVLPRHRLADRRDANEPCPEGAVSSVNSHIWRRYPTVNSYFSKKSRRTVSRGGRWPVGREPRRGERPYVDRIGCGQRRFSAPVILP